MSTPPSGPPINPFPCGGKGERACPPVSAFTLATGETIVIHGAFQLERIDPSVADLDAAVEAIRTNPLAGPRLEDA